MSAPELPIPSTSKACDDLIHDVPPPNDIGLLLDPTKSIEEICEVVGQLSNDQKCSPITFSNIFTLLKIFATLPLSSCSCERSGLHSKD